MSYEQYDYLRCDGCGKFGCECDGLVIIVAARRGLRWKRTRLVCKRSISAGCLADMQMWARVRRGRRVEEAYYLTGRNTDDDRRRLIA